jgi:SAM-dependent methyltransferase
VIGFRRRRVPRLDELPAFSDSASYWESRYALGQSSGVGSYEQLAAFKADVLNGFVAEHGVRSVLELGCGDGAQLALARYPAYQGYDVASSAVSLCRKRFRRDATKSFGSLEDFAEQRPQADLALSLDVVFHLVEDEVFDQHLRDLFGAARRFACVYSSNDERPDVGAHVRHRVFTRWVTDNRPGWQLVRHVPNPFRGELEGAVADFWFYARPT